MSSPAVTVLLPVRNGAATLQSSLTSILRQTFTNIEVLVIDDGSTDETPAILRACTDPRLRVLRNEKNIGLMRTLNRGLREARGELIARQDADDLSEPDRLARQLEFLERHPQVQLLGTSCWRMNPAGRVTGANDLPSTHHALRWASVLDNPFIHTSVIFRRATALDELGGYNEALSICEDYDLWNRIAARHRVANLPERLVYYREHGTSMMQSRPEAASRAMRDLLRANLGTVFPERTFSEEEVELLSLFRLRFPRERLAPLCALIETLREEYCGRYPQECESADFRATVCREHLRLAYKFLRSAPRIAAAQIWSGLEISPGEWFRQARGHAIGMIGFQPVTGTP